MDACRWRKAWAVLLILPALLLTPGSVRAEADFVTSTDDFEPTERPEVEASTPPSALSVLAALLNHGILGYVGVPQTIVETVDPPPPLTLVVPMPPTMPQLVSLPFSDPLTVNYLTVPVMQSFNVWTPTSSSVDINNVQRTPEPGSLLSALFGLSGLFWARRRYL